MVKFCKSKACVSKKLENTGTYQHQERYIHWGPAMQEKDMFVISCVSSSSMGCVQRSVACAQEN